MKPNEGISHFAARRTRLAQAMGGGVAVIPTAPERLRMLVSRTRPAAEAVAVAEKLGAELVPPDRALVETDTPYLAPPPHRGEQNEPAWVAHVGEALARVWGLSTSEVAETTSANASRVFSG